MLQLIQIVQKYNSNKDNVEKGIANFKQFLINDFNIEQEKIQQFCDNSLQVDKLFTLFLQYKDQKKEDIVNDVYQRFVDHYQCGDVSIQNSDKFKKYLMMFYELLCV